MDKAEFNLSVLENAVDFSSPFRSCANYENIVSLIKEEIDINAEDETEPSKVTKRATHVARVSECGDSNGVFKSPHKRNSFPRARTPAARKRRTHEFQRNERTTDRAETPRARSLGAVKPGRSGQWRRNHSSTSHSSDGADTSVSEATEPVLDRTAESGKQNRAEPNRAETKFNGAGEVQSTTGLSEKPDRLYGVSSSPGVTQSDDFVESSQSRTSSTLRTKLISNGECGGRLNGEDASDGYAESDEDCQNFSLKFSPAAKSLASNPDSSVTPPRLGKRRGSATSSAEGPASKLQKVSASTNAKMPGCEISAVPSPFKVLTQEMENCITSSDYEQMSENLQSDTANSASFTFETIELLNEYEDSNEQVNNRILSKIFSSPSSTKVKEEPADSSEPVLPCDQWLVEDPLRIVENVRTSGPARETKRASCSKVRKAKDAKTTVRKKSANVVRRSSSKSPSQVTSETSENVASGGAARRKSKTKKSTLPKERARSKSLEIKTELDENVATSEAREPTEKRTENEVGEKLEEDKRRRHSARLAVKTPAKMALSELEDDVDLAVEAVNVSKRIEEVAKKMVTGKRTLTKLTDMVIRLRHEVLPQHTIESRAGSKALTYSQQKQFLRFAPLSKETYSPAEDEIICSNWRAFCQDHDWNPEDYKPFLRLKHGDRLIMRSLAKRRLFVQFLANGLPNRPLCSVYSRFKTLYGERSSAGARYTSEEDMQILAYMLHKPAENPDHKCSELAKVLDRTRESISKRYKKLMKKYCEDNENKVSTKVEWNLPLAGKFISTLLDVSLSKNTMELKDAFIPKVVWLKMEEKMKIDHQLLKRFWEQQLHLQLFAEKPLYLNRIKIMLIEHMYAKQIWHPTEIKWRHIVRNFDGLTISFLRKIFNHLTMKTSTKIRTRNFKRILDWLYTKKIEELMSGPRDKCLPRIFYKDKMARFCIEDVGALRSGSECSETNELHV